MSRSGANPTRSRSLRIYEGRTTGTAIGFLIRNEDQRPKDYSAIAEKFPAGTCRLHLSAEVRRARCARRRPRLGARDRDPRRRGSHREEMAARALRRAGARYLAQLGRTGIPFESWDAVEPNPFFAPNAGMVAQLEKQMVRAARVGDSCGARVNVVASAVPVGWGEPVYGRLDADIAGAMMSVNAVKASRSARASAPIVQKGSEHGDEMTPQGFVSNNNGGVLGGISTGQDVNGVAIALKPTSSIRLPRRTIDRRGAPRRSNRRAAIDGPRDADLWLTPIEP